MKPLAEIVDTRTHLDQMVVEEVTLEDIKDSRPPKKKKIIKLHHFVINKIYDHQNKAIRLQIVKIQEEGHAGHKEWKAELKK